LVAGTSATPGELTITPVYWVPSGSSMPAAYEQLINQFITDAAADSGKNTNVFSVVDEYTDADGVQLSYRLHAGTPITDTDPFPPASCAPDTGSVWADGTAYSVCVTNAQLVAEASRFTTAHGLPNSDFTHLYMFFLPKGVETCFSSANGAGGGECSINSGRPAASFCGYHAFASPPLVANMNYAFAGSATGYTCGSEAGSNTPGAQSPNGNIDADTEISVASHEIIETITDPQGYGWVDNAGNEIADDCGYIYGDDTTFQGVDPALYNQTINGHHYFVQEEFSNKNFAIDPTSACVQQENAQAPAITSGDTENFRERRQSAFTVTTVGIPSATLSEYGALPRGVTFVDNQNGTATIAGKPAHKTGGKYQILLGADNGIDPAAVQLFTLKVVHPPRFQNANAVTFTHGIKHRFAVHAIGPPLPGKISRVGALPKGVSFSSRGGGKGVLRGTAAASTKGKTFILKFKVSNGIGKAAQKFKLSVK
jgi:hypothetical protein